MSVFEAVYGTFYFISLHTRWMAGSWRQARVHSLKTSDILPQEDFQARMSLRYKLKA